MDSFEFNKMIGALLGTVFFVFSISLISDAIFAAPVPEKPGFAIEAAEEEHGGGGGGEAPGAGIGAAAAGQRQRRAGAAVFKKCAACHTDDASGANKVGPNLWGIVNRPVASHAGFAYSAPMKEFAQGGSVVWDYEHLDHFLLSPKGLVKGTAMGFAGLKKVEERAALIAYLRSKADSPAPLPEASAAPAAETAAAPADGAAPADAAQRRLKAQRPPSRAAAPAEGAAPNRACAGTMTNL